MDRQNVLNVFQASIDAVDPYAAVKNIVKIKDGKLHLSETVFRDLDEFERVLVDKTENCCVVMVMVRKWCETPPTTIP